MNANQERLFDNLHTLNVILKARQLGFSTFIQLLMLDACLWNPNIRAGVIAHNREDASVIFRDKIKFAYDGLPEGLRQAMPAERESARELRFANNSSIRVGTSMRSGTVQYLHVSEYGKIAVLYPQKAREIKTGAFNAVHAGQFIFVESTAEGQEGAFFELCEAARLKARLGTPLGQQDFKFHFFPWWDEPTYREAGDGPIAASYVRYFDKLADLGIELDAEQRLWYAGRAEMMQDDMKREFPSYPQEAFEVSLEGCYYADQMARAEEEGRICRVHHQEGKPVHTFWDLGGSGTKSGDLMAIWFIQNQFNETHVIDYYQNSGEDLPHYAKLLHKWREKKGYVYGKHLWPHDGGHGHLGLGSKKLNELMGDLGIDVQVQPRTDVQVGIQAVRQMLSRCWFDQERCAEGLKALRSYRKEWDEIRGIWKPTPRHDFASHGADAFRTGVFHSPGGERRSQRYSGKPTKTSAWAA